MPGEVNRGVPLGEALFELARQPDVLKCMEIGTGNGEGSTYCVAQGLAEHGGELWTLEMRDDCFRSATAFYAGKGLPVHLVHGLALSADDCPDLDSLEPEFASTSMEIESPGSFRAWYEHERALAAVVEHTGVLAPLVAREAPFDLVFLDGSEFPTRLEFERLEHHIRRYVVLDDSNGAVCIKGAVVRARIIGSQEWRVLEDRLDDRHGWLVAERV